MSSFRHRIKRFWRFVSHINPLYFLAATLVFGIVCVVALRRNNEHMQQLRTALYQADKNNSNVQLALNNLQAYVVAHMNTNLSTGNGSVYPPIQLQYTYERLLQAEEQNVATTNSGLYTAAQIYCQKIDPVDFSGHNRVPCIEQYVSSHGASMPSIPTALYEFDFVSPSWSPDLAGWTLLLTALSFVATACLFLVRLASKLTNY